ncbi:hypothetical protein CVD28_05185 [Bacillus sp. M6-12]|uniref:TRAP transporter small permease n=1 Tax=Bacillus sp. M6-12 TaxID=2054166 RepID=UPI000C76752E|nr:TRAP transporter small permease [Bacillus sp. M6-12]PLS18534.1 hypothetical protein CVD28_05185 [Bacillus sp. M6-12]
MQSKDNVVKSGVLNKINKGLEQFVKSLIVISVGAMSLVLVIAVICRYILKSPLVGADELAILLLSWITFLGASLAIRRNEMVSVTILTDIFPKEIRKAVVIIVQILIITFSIIMLFYGYIWINSTNVLAATSSALHIPMWVPYSIFPFSMLVITIFSLENIKNLIINK